MWMYIYNISIYMCKCITYIYTHRDTHDTVRDIQFAPHDDAPSNAGDSPQKENAQMRQLFSRQDPDTSGPYRTSPHGTTATHCNMLQHTATHCNTLQRSDSPQGMTTRHCNTLQHTATRCSMLQHTTACSPIGMTAPHCSTLQRTATHNTLQHTATHCNTLQHTATHCISLQRRELIFVNGDAALHETLDRAPTRTL